MGIDFQFIAYTGAALSEESLANAILEKVRIVTLYRHARAFLPGRADLHLIALYEGPDDGRHTVKMPLPELPPEASLSAIVQAAWKATRQVIKDAPVAVTEPLADEAELTRVAILARELSLSVEKTYWVSQGDHSCIGGYAQFENGKLVEPASVKDIYIEGDGYLDVPERKWLAATNTGVIPNVLFFQAFPEGNEPPLRVATDLTKQIAFDGARFNVSLE